MISIFPIFAADKPTNKSNYATTKLTINSNGSVKIEGDFELVDRNGTPYGLAGRENRQHLPLWPLSK